jgi:ribA/ribD-fused uncharacterized protein
MTQPGLYCATCGRPSPDEGCCLERGSQEVGFDRDGDALWDQACPRFCELCAERLPARVIHGGVEHTCDPREIRFYGVSSDYGAFSNFAAYPIRIEGTTYPTSEHYFQTQKFAGSAYADTIRKARTAMTAAKLGRSRRHRLRSDWESVKRDVMLTALRAKFDQHEDLRELLLGTADAKLVEHTHNDAYWGDGGDGSGKNWLGRLLTRVREELRAET